MKKNYTSEKYFIKGLEGNNIGEKILRILILIANELAEINTRVWELNEKIKR
jgi:hypothetical protein